MSLSKYAKAGAERVEIDTPSLHPEPPEEVETVDSDTFEDILDGPKTLAEAVEKGESMRKSANFDIGSRGNHLEKALRTRPVSEAEVNLALDTLKIAAMNADICLSDSQLMAMKQLPYELPPQHQPYGAQFSLAQELDRQLTMTSALRQSILDPMTGRPKDNVSPREAKEVITACSTLFAMLMKHQATVRTYERQTEFEKAVADTVRDYMTPEQRDVFLAKLGEALESLPN